MLVYKSEGTVNMIFAGVDVHQDFLTIAIIDEKLKIHKLENMRSEDFLEYLLSNKIDIMAVDAPLSLNKGLMDDENYRMSLNRNLKGHYNKKVSEYMLSQMGIRAFPTPREITEVTGWKSWMKVGFDLHEQLINMGFQDIKSDDASTFFNGIIEVFPHGCFTVLSNGVLGKKTSKEGIGKRSELLKKLGFLDVEIYINGLSNKKSSDILDSLICAYTALQIQMKGVIFVGDPYEGEIALPSK